jgi:polar amino acid transport system substrate-binding protein
MASSAQGREIEIFTVEAPPLTMGEDHKNGIVGDATIEALKRIGHGAKLVFEPWARSQEQVPVGQDQLIIPLTRTAERESHFTWIAPIYELGRAFATMGRPINTYAEAQAKLNQIGVLRGSANQTLLQENGVSSDKIMALATNANQLEMLQMGRLDAWFHSIPEIKWAMRQHPEIQGITLGAPLSLAYQYLACSKKCDTDLVDKLRGAIEDMRKDGTLQKIIQRYE